MSETTISLALPQQPASKLPDDPHLLIARTESAIAEGRQVIAQSKVIREAQAKNRQINRAAVVASRAHRERLKLEKAAQVVSHALRILGGRDGRLLELEAIKRHILTLNWAALDAALQNIARLDAVSHD
jgi:hypothetical protein